jgi:hypothetical protein
MCSPHDLESERVCAHDSVVRVEQRMPVAVSLRRSARRVDDVGKSGVARTRSSAIWAWCPVRNCVLS